MYIERRSKVPDPIVWKSAPLPHTAGSVASTAVTSAFKASYATDLCDLGGIGSVTLPAGSLDARSSSEEGESGEEGSRYGKFARTACPRGYSIESRMSVDEADNSEELEIFSRLSIEADRMTRSSGCHVKVQKLTTSQSCPYKTLLRHPN